MQGFQVLVIDDLANMRSALRRICLDLGAHQCDVAADGEEALKALRSRPYDLVLCDYNLGEGRDGQQVLEEARHRKLVAPGCAFLMITAEADLPLVLGAVEGRPDDYLVKPVVRDVLALRLRRVLARKQVLRPLEQAIADDDPERAITLCETLKSQFAGQAGELARLRAELCFEAGRYDEAAALCEQALAEAELDWARFGLGRARIRQGRVDEGCRELGTLLRANAWYIEAYDWLADVHESRGDLEAACAALQSALALSDKSVRRQRRLAQLAQRLQQPALAERALRAAIRVGNGSCFAGAGEYLQLSALYESQGDTTSSLNVLREARRNLQDQPADVAEICADQVRVYQLRGAEREARITLDVAVSQAARASGQLRADTALQLAGACLSFGQQGEALKFVERAMQNATDETETAASARALLETHGLEKHAAALIDAGCEEILRLNNHGVKLYQDKRGDEAAELLMQAAERLPRNRRINLNAARVLLNLMLEQGRNVAYLQHARRYIERLRQLGESSAELERMQRVYGQLQRS